MNGQLNIEEYVDRLKALHDNDDKENAHIWADDILEELLRALGYGEVADAFDAIGKWYA